MTALADMTPEVAAMTCDVVNRHRHSDVVADRHTVTIFARAYVLSCLEIERVGRAARGEPFEDVLRAASWWRIVSDAYEPAPGLSR